MVVLATLFSATYNQADGIIATRCGERMLTAMTSSTSSSAAKSNGWCYRYQIYGLLVVTERGEYKRQTIETT